ncbi:hypothetical protein M758_8G141600 [Ceratodon purpureus]|uniref:Uncharacterized protein n=1 Tax=Ceratodon purpureus TaxID=3225 RepID=A0A8T0H2A9_CERPU|nr:hypothetical protein KC19_8G145300 [Ceratodon purpureus]KAG0608899.1 hypothetical protein M758_8G141600 [Ceratodon purpureus]
MHVDVAELTSITPLTIRERAPARIAQLLLLNPGSTRSERQRMRVLAAPESRLQRAILRMQIILAHPAVIRGPFTQLETQITNKVTVVVWRLVNDEKPFCEQPRWEVIHNQQDRPR